MESESTHLFLDGTKMIISPDIAQVFQFLIEVDKEVQSLLGFQEKINGIRNQYVEMINFVQFLAGKLKENHVDFEYKFQEHPELIAEKFNLHLPVRSQMIVVFASLEVLYSLHISYEKEISDEDKMREQTMDKENLKKFLNAFLLSDANDYYKNNRSKLSRVDSNKIRKLRNALAHFFSLDGSIFVVPEVLKDKAKDLERVLKQNKHGNIISLSPEDLYEWIKAAHVLRMKKWSEDFQNNPSDFKKKIYCVVEVVKREGALVVPHNYINLK